MKDGRTPLDMALVQYQENVIHLLLCYGATLDDADTNPLEISVYKKTMSVLHHNGEY
jgi:ankyrin repeat protein